MNNLECQFQVAAISEINGDVTMGQRSILTIIYNIVVTVTTSAPPPGNLGPIIGGVLVFFMAVATAAIVMALVVYWIRRYNHNIIIL